MHTWTVCTFCKYWSRKHVAEYRERFLFFAIDPTLHLLKSGWGNEDNVRENAEKP